MQVSLLTPLETFYVNNVKKLLSSKFFSASLKLQYEGLGNVSLHIEFSSIPGISLNSHKVSIIIQKTYMNVYNYDYPQTLKISKQHVHRSLCCHTEGRIISYNEMEKWGQVNHPEEQRVMQQLRCPRRAHSLKDSVLTKSNWAHYVT